MLATPHLLTGTAIAAVLRRPLLAWPTAFASHFVLDFVPHLDSHALFGTAQGGPTGPEVAMAVLDTLVGIALVAASISVALRNHDPRSASAPRRLMAGGAFFALMIDLMQNIDPWAAWFRQWPGMASLESFHHGFQHNVTPADWPLGFGTQAVVTALALCVIGHGSRRIDRPSHSPDRRAKVVH
jgi:hypothetical protein